MENQPCETHFLPEVVALGRNIDGCPISIQFKLKADARTGLKKRVRFVITVFWGKI